MVLLSPGLSWVGLAEQLSVGGSNSLTVKLAEQVATSRGHRVAVFETGMLDLRGVCVAAIGGARFARGETDRAASLEPLYIRTPEATFKPTSKNPAGIGTEGVWSIERKNSFSGI